MSVSDVFVHSSIWALKLYHLSVGIPVAWPLGRMYSYFRNWGKGGMSFSQISHTRYLSGSVICYEVKKNCRINFQCRCKNVIMVVYGKSDCGPCPRGQFIWGAYYGP